MQMNYTECIHTKAVQDRLNTLTVRKPCFMLGIACLQPSLLMPNATWSLNITGDLQADMFNCAAAIILFLMATLKTIVQA